MVSAITPVLFLVAGLFPSETAPQFSAARPVWPKGRETEMNLFVGYRGLVEAPAGSGKTVLRVTTAYAYRAFVNGEFAAYGPARGPHGYYRVDEWDISKQLRPGVNVVAIQASGYNIDTYSYINQPAFLQAEVVSGETVLAATGDEKKPFEATILTERVQKIQRYSQQRAFTESYRLSSDGAAWLSDPKASIAAVPCATAGEKALLPRRVLYPEFTLRKPVRHVSEGGVKTGITGVDENQIKSVLSWGLHRNGYPVEQFEVTQMADLMRTANENVKSLDKAAGESDRIEMGTNTFHILDLGTNLTGFIKLRAEVKGKTKLYLAFDEILSNGDVNFTRLGGGNVILYECPPGSYDIETFEPYTLRYLKLVVLAGQCSVEKVALREYVNPDTQRAKFSAKDERLNRLFAAAVETYRQNAVDIFMDCPSRERAGWLCDSFFTARVAYDLSGNTLVERNMYENFLLPPKYPNLPDGMLPMCYPSDHGPNSFIPNWAMWFVVQLEEYVERSGDRKTADALKPKVMALLDYFKPFRNESGLLEKLQSWVFVEWSKANDFVQDVNYPSNMLYARTLEAAGRLYGQDALIAEAKKVRETINKQSFDGEFFVDNAVRKDGKLQVTRNRSETCQYYAFYLGTATPKTHAKLWRVLCEQFGPKRKESKAFPEIHPSNAFIGNVLRLDMLAREGLAQQVLDETVGYNLYMADQTGTLWENDTSVASCNHGFASHVAHLLYRDVLGVRRCDAVNKKVQVRFSDLRMDGCEGQVPTPHGVVQLKWWKDGDKLAYRIRVPDGYKADIDNVSGRELVEKP